MGKGLSKRQHGLLDALSYCERPTAGFNPSPDQEGTGEDGMTPSHGERRRRERFQNRRALQSLERRGLVASEMHEGERWWRLTDIGRDYRAGHTALPPLAPRPRQWQPQRRQRATANLPAAQANVLTFLSPPLIRGPFARYSHGVNVEAGARILFCSGQLGIAPDDKVPERVGDQTKLCLENIRAVLEEANMGVSDIVRLNAYVTDRAYLADYMRARDRFIEGTDPPPASTLMIVSGFAREVFKVEVEAIAAARGHGAPLVGRAS